MNGEIVNLIELVSDLKVTLNGQTNQIELNKNINKIDFYIKKKEKKIKNFFKKSDDTYENIASSVLKWKEYLIDKGMEKASLVMGLPAEQDINLAGFTNGNNQWVILTYHKEFCMVWLKRWSFLDDIKKWDVAYYGIELKQQIAENNYFINDNLLEVEYALKEISSFAFKIKENFWGEYFDRALAIINNKKNSTYISLPESYPQENKVLLSAISTGWCFGAMGSWNDSPPYSAHSLDLDDEYNEVSSKLYTAFLNGLEAAVNAY